MFPSRRPGKAIGERKRFVMGCADAGRPASRRDAVTLARAVLEDAAVRAGEAVLEADDCEWLPRLVEPLNAVLVGAGERAAEAGLRAKPAC